VGRSIIRHVSELGYSYGQDLTPVNVPNLSWHIADRSPILYVGDTRLIFPGLAISLTYNGKTQRFMVTSVYPHLGYVTIINAGQNGLPYLPTFGDCT
jgi:hypothetical protein